MTGYDSKRDAAADKLQEPVDIASIIACREMLDAQPVPARTSVHEALTLALEALEEAWYHVGTFQPTEKAIDLYDEARTAIKEALAQPAQEPVAWMHVQGNYKEPSFYELADDEVKRGWEQYPLYTTPPQREWVGLTDDEVNNFAAGCHLGKSVQGAIYEAASKLKERNHGT